MLSPLFRFAHLSRSRSSFVSAALLHTSRCMFAKNKVVKQFLLADIGEGITECEVLKWSIRPQSAVGHFDPLCEVQSDKASVEITSPFDGVLKTILVQEGEIAKVGQGLCLIEIEEEDSAPVAEDASNAPEGRAPEPAKPEPVAEPSLRTPVEAEAPSQERRPHPLDPSAVRLPSASSKDVLATPSVRHFARQNNIQDLSVLAPGSGKGGRIERKDVEAYLAAASAPPSVAPAAAKGPQSTAEPTETVLDLGRTRWAMWKSMTKSLEIPHFGYSTTLDLTELTTLLPVLNAHIPEIYKPQTLLEYPPSVSPFSVLPSPPAPATSDALTHYTHLTILPLLLKTLSRAMQAWPLFRSSITPNAEPYSTQNKPTLTLRPRADINIALATPTGLYTPTLRAVDTKSAYAIMGELRRMQALGRRVPCGLTPEDMPRRGGTITVSNVGAIGKGEWAAPLLVPGGGVAIAAIGRAKWVQRENGRRFEIGVSWSADHRVVEGAELAAFVEDWRSWVEHPARMVADSV